MLCVGWRGRVLRACCPLLVSCGSGGGLEQSRLTLGLITMFVMCVLRRRRAAMCVHYVGVATLCCDRANAERTVLGVCVCLHCGCDLVCVNVDLMFVGFVFVQCLAVS